MEVARGEHVRGRGAQVAAAARHAAARDAGAAVAPAVDRDGIRRGGRRRRRGGWEVVTPAAPGASSPSSAAARDSSGDRFELAPGPASDPASDPVTIDRGGDRRRRRGGWEEVTPAAPGASSSVARGVSPAAAELGELIAERPGFSELLHGAVASMRTLDADDLRRTCLSIIQSSPSPRTDGSGGSRRRVRDRRAVRVGRRRLHRGGWRRSRRVHVRDRRW